jgi:alkylated DNA repair protein (DNA oxidative demethylase)
MSVDGFKLFPGHLDGAVQAALSEEIFLAEREAPFYRPVIPGGRVMSVRMTNFGPLGWVSDASGYRYQAQHPITGQAWPNIPRALIDLWRSLTDAPVDPDCCLVNLYDAQARMGLHQDKDEADFVFPVLSVSLGDTAVFRIGGESRKGPTATVRLASGDICLLAGPARLAFHGVDRILAGSSRLIPGGGRLNLTLRRAGPA